MSTKKSGNSNEDVFILIKEQYFNIDSNYEALNNACKTEEEKSNLKRDYIIARSNYRKSLNLKFDENDPIIKGMIKGLKKLEDRIKKDIKAMNIASDILSMISESVKIASSIVVVVMGLV